MWLDPIVEEIHKIREERAKRFNYDLKAMYDDLKECGFIYRKKNAKGAKGAKDAIK
jgi:transposase